MLPETSRLRFRPHLESDLEPFCAMQLDVEFRRYVGGKPRSRAGAEAKFQSTYLPLPPDEWALWATELKETGEYIGYCGVYLRFGENGPIPDEGSLAYYLARAHWGKGLATEASVTFVDWAFKEKGLKRIVADHEEGHISSQKILEKLGFRRVAIEGEGRVFWSYELLPEAWNVIRSELI